MPRGGEQRLGRVRLLPAGKLQRVDRGEVEAVVVVEAARSTHLLPARRT